MMLKNRLRLAKHYKEQGKRNHPYYSELKKKEVKVTNGRTSIPKHSSKTSKHNRT